MEKQKNNKIIFGVVLIIIFFVILDFVAEDWLDGFEFKVSDAKFKLRNAFNKSPEFSQDIVFVNIDNYSKQKSGLSLWPKTYYADLINKIAEKDAEVIAVDILFGASSDTLGNAAIVNSIAHAGNVISPYMAKFKTSDSDATIPIDPELYNAFAFGINPIFKDSGFKQISQILYHPLIPIIEQSYTMGFANLEPDSDGVLRRIPVISSYNDHLALSFFFQSVCSYLDYSLENVEINANRRIILHDFPINNEKRKKINLPLDENGNLIINYAGSMIKDVKTTSYSAWDLLHSDSGSISFKDKLVILSDISTAAKDYCTTPYDKVLWNSYILANAMNTVVNQHFINQLPTSTSWCFIIVFSLLLLLLYRRLSDIQFNIFSVGFLIIYAVINFSMFVIGDFSYPFLQVIITCLFIYLYLSISKHYATEIEKVRLESRLRSYLSPVLMKKIQNNPDILKVGGERKFITVLFSDIVNFTGFCDEADPAAVQEVLKEYFDKGVELVFKYNGIVDKYLGDGMLAFFENDDSRYPSQLSAVKCAIEFQQAAEELNKYFIKKMDLDFRIRIGIATGYAKVGNIGPVQKTDYTIIGSVVNLASRLEGVADPGEITFDELTLRALPEDIKYKDIGEQQIKGYKKPVKVYKIKR